MKLTLETEDKDVLISVTMPDDVQRDSFILKAQIAIDAFWCGTVQLVEGVDEQR